jgi:uncharacterized protein YggE
MRRPMAALLMVVALLGAACTPATQATAGNPAQIAQAPEQDPSPPRGIAVSGQGEVMGTPDVLTVDLGVSVLRDEASQAIAEAARLAEEVVAVLTAAGVAREDIQTLTYSIFPEYDFSQDTQRLIGYRVQNVLTAKLRQLDRAGQTIDAATGAAGEDVVVHGIRFDIDDNQALLEAARTAAWQDARAKAEQLAGLAGVVLGEPVSITESFSSTPPPIFFEGARAAEEFAADTPIEPGGQAVTVTISVVFDSGP